VPLTTYYQRDDLVDRETFLAQHPTRTARDYNLAKSHENEAARKRGLPDPFPSTYRKRGAHPPAVSCAPQATFAVPLTVDAVPGNVILPVVSESQAVADVASVEAYRHAERAVPTAGFTSDKRTGRFHWKDAVAMVERIQEFHAESSWSQYVAAFNFDTDKPICVIALSDTHIGSLGSDHALLARITQEILDTPNLYVAFLGDVAEVAIKLRSVTEVMGNVLTPEMQLDFVESWLTDIAPRTLFATYGNHEERTEQQSGINPFARAFSRKVVYFSGIGHADITVGTQTYRLAASHKFRGSSQDNPCHSGSRYLLREGADREIALAGDSHRPGVLLMTHSGEPKLAINSGTLQLNSGYARRYFSLKTCPVFPVFTLDPHAHMFTPYWSLQHYLQASK